MPRAHPCPLAPGAPARAVELGYAQGASNFLQSTDLVPVGTGPFAFTALGALPPGLILNGTTGTIFGIPTAPGSWTFTLVITDSLGLSDSHTYTIQVWDYDSKILAMFPGDLLAYWPGDEPVGTATEYDRGLAHSDGTYSNVTTGQPGIGDGKTAPVGTQAPISSSNVYTAALSSGFVPNESTVMQWARPTSGATWTSGGTELIIEIVDVASTHFLHMGHFGNGTLIGRWHGSAVNLHATGLSGTGWFHLCMSQSAAEDARRLYLNGALAEAQLAGIGAWTTANPATKAVLGNATTPAGANAWPGANAKTAIVRRKITDWEAHQAGRLRTAGVWRPLGVIAEPSLPATENQFVGEPNVIIEGSPAILTGAPEVFKRWSSAGNDVAIISVNYAESLTGLPNTWVDLPDNPVIVGSTRASGPVTVGGVKYMVVQLGAGTQLDLLKSTDGGITWTMAQAGILTPTATELAFYNSCLVIHGGTWHLFYDFQTTDATYIYATGYASSSGPTSPFTRFAGNPIISHAPSLGALGTSGGMFVWVSPTTGKWYAWGQCSTVVVPTDIVRFEANAPQGPWGQSTSGLALPRHSPSTGWFNSYGQIADLSLVEHNGRTYCFFAALYTASQQTQIEVAVADLTLDQLVLTDEGIVLDYSPRCFSTAARRRPGPAEPISSQAGSRAPEMEPLPARPPSGTSFPARTARPHSSSQPVPLLTRCCSKVCRT